MENRIGLPGALDIVAGQRRVHDADMRGDVSSAALPDRVVGRPMPLYVHVPFCESLCPFCPFHRVLLDEPLADAYYKVLAAQLRRLADDGWVFIELCMGGGTPTTRPQALVALIQQAMSLWDLRQVTVETNPNHLRDEILQPLLDAGVTRLSVGVQSLHDGRLEKLGRLHAYGGRDRILEAIGNTQGRFDTFNVDMIFNLPEQTIDELDEDLRLLKATGVDQISYHPLMPTDEDLHGESDFGHIDFHREHEMYRRIVACLEPEYQRGSVWCFDRKPQVIDEYFVSNPEYLGIGSGAFSLLDAWFHATSFDIGHYMESCHDGDLVFAQRHRLGVLERQAYRLLTGLFGVRVPVARMGGMRWLMPLLQGGGLLRRQGGFYELSERGCYVWLVMMRRFFMAVNRYRQQLRRGEEAPCPFTVGRVLLRLWG